MCVPSRPPKQQRGEPHSPEAVHSQTPFPQTAWQSTSQLSQFSIGTEHTPSPQKQSLQLWGSSPQLTGSHTPSPQWQSIPQVAVVSLHDGLIMLGDQPPPGYRISSWLAVHPFSHIPFPHVQSCGHELCVSPRSMLHKPSPHAQSPGQLACERRGDMNHFGQQAWAFVARLWPRWYMFCTCTCTCTSCACDMYMRVWSLQPS